MRKKGRSVIVKILREDKARTRRWGIRTPLEWAVWRATRGYFDNMKVTELKGGCCSTYVVWVYCYRNRRQAYLVLRPRFWGGYTLRLPNRLFQNFSLMDTISMEEEWLKDNTKDKYPVG